MPPCRTSLGQRFQPIAGPGSTGDAGRIDGASEQLSAREQDVLRAVAHGASNREVADALLISEATVKTHLIHIFQKLRVADRTAAVTVALERGVLQLWRCIRGDSTDRPA